MAGNLNSSSTPHPYKCICDFQTVVKEEFKQHLRQCEETYLELKCEECSCKKTSSHTDPFVVDFYDEVEEEIKEEHDNTNENTEKTLQRNVTAAYATIDLKKNWVTFHTRMLLHEGSYQTNLVQMGSGLLMLFVFNQIPEASHKCILNKKREPPVLLLRSASEDNATIVVKCCTPVGELEGKYTHKTEDSFTASLKFKIDTIPGQNVRKTKGKHHCCCYCRKMYVDMTDHLLKKHSSEGEVKKIFKMKVHSRERHQALRNLRKKGDFEYNMQVPPEKRIVLRRMTKANMKKALTCYKCHALLSPTNFARHERRCTGREANRERVATKARRLELQNRE